MVLAYVYHRPRVPSTPHQGGGRMRGDMSFHWEMLNDADRNQAYREAISQHVPGRVVYDLGAGVGPMSYYALASGARRVYGFEIDGDAYPYLRRLARLFPNFVPLHRDVVRERFPEELPEVAVCEMWSVWLTDWPMVRVLNRLHRVAPRCLVIPARGHHVVQLVRARERAGLPLGVSPGTEAALFGHGTATEEMSLPVRVAVTDFQRPIRPVDVTVSVRPLTSGRVDAVRLWSYEEVTPGRILPRVGTRSDALLRWIPPLEVREGRQVRLRIRHRWGPGLSVSVL